MDLPHFERASRRAFLRHGLAATGALTAAGVLAACSKSDADTFSAVTTTTTTTAAAATATTVAPTTAAAAPSSTAAAVATAATKVQIAFTYTASDSSGRVRNPYVAVWVENSGGDLVALIGVWYSTRDAKYLRELTEFTGVSTTVGADQLDAVSGATRAAGEYQLQWDGRGLDGALDGAHTLWVEAAREHGPHSVTSGPLTLGAAATTKIAGNGELSDIAVTVG